MFWAQIAFTNNVFSIEDVTKYFYFYKDSNLLIDLLTESFTLNYYLTSQSSQKSSKEFESLRYFGRPIQSHWVLLRCMYG